MTHPYGSPDLRVQILNIWKMRNLSIWLVDPFLIWPMKSAYSAIRGFDWVLISCVVCIIQIFRICTLRAGNPYGHWNYFSLKSWNWTFCKRYLCDFNEQFVQSAIGDLFVCDTIQNHTDLIRSQVFFRSICKWLK